MGASPGAETNPPNTMDRGKAPKPICGVQRSCAHSSVGRSMTSERSACSPSIDTRPAALAHRPNDWRPRPCPSERLQERRSEVSIGVRQALRNDNDWKTLPKLEDSNHIQRPAPKAHRTRNSVVLCRENGGPLSTCRRSPCKLLPPLTDASDYGASLAYSLRLSVTFNPSTLSTLPAISQSLS